MVRDGVVVIDVGINRIDDPTHPKGHRLVGDVKFDEVSRKASAITPVPGGVGPMTITMLLSNTLESARAAAARAKTAPEEPDERHSWQSRIIDTLVPSLFWYYTVLREVGLYEEAHRLGVSGSGGAAGLHASTNDSFLLQKLDDQSKSRALTEAGVEEYDIHLVRQSEFDKIADIRNYFVVALKYDSTNSRAQQYLSIIDDYKNVQLRASLRSAARGAPEAEAHG